jgi:hypothetical protein
MKEKSIVASGREKRGWLKEARPMRRGSVSVRYMKCGQRACRCQGDSEFRHGPYYSLTRGEGGKTRSRYLSPEQAAVAQRQVEAGQEFRREVEEHWQACEKLADAELGEIGSGPAEQAEKKGSKPRSSRR